jgi:inner membrane protein
MDSITHVVLGACVAEAIAPSAGSGKSGKVGKRVLLVGAAAQSLPDIDFVASFWLNPANDLLAHRGFTHSLLFVALAAPALALITDKYLIPRTFAMRKWIMFYLLQVFVHIFLDAFNAYGVAWFEPFSHTRVSFNALFVADPFLTIPLTVACAYLLLANNGSSRRRLAALLALAWFIGFLAYAILIKASINRAVTANIHARNMQVSKYFSTPTPLNTWLWYIVANTPNGSYVGYRSIFDRGDSIAFEFFPRSEELLAPVADHEDLQHLKRFSEGYYTVEKRGDTLVFNDLRFGQMIGWRDPRAGFVFQYYLSHPTDNELVVQRGRFKGWDRDAAASLINRALGKHVTDRGLPVGNRK